ncbi:MAG TPA: Ig-like domain-containing protein [Candidatus Limnocylindrales bacterium]|nr:Ig-like domain-containing protein [Candidatus Limnocylindrales bacterium]
MAVVAVVVIGAGALLQGGPSVRPSQSPGGTAGTSPGATAPGSSPNEDWAALDLAPVAATATLEPSGQDPAGIPRDASFSLKSLAGEPPEALAARLEVSPRVALTVTGSSGDRATVKPARPLAPGRAYRFLLRAPDGTLAGSWLFRVRGPVRVASTIPGARATGVPVATGIEVTFDQEGVADMADHFSISPKVNGSFQRRGRVQAFVPESLSPATLYTVTLRAGLARTDTDLALESDYVWRFETEGPQSSAPRLRFGREVLEASPTERPLVALRAIVPEVNGAPGPMPSTTAVRVYRFASLDDAARSVSAFLAEPRWSEHSDPLMATDGLPVAASFSATLEPLRDDLLLLRFPARLAVGSYIVEIGQGRKAHAFLQVTPVSAWVSVLSDRTVAWVNDVTTGEPVEGATVALGTGEAFARSRADGLAIGPTPRGLVPPLTEDDAQITQPPMLRIRSAAGESLLVPFGAGSDGGIYRGEWSEKSSSADETYWAMLFTDRGLYRTDDRIQVWGYLRSRDGGVVPRSVDVRLVAQAAQASGAQPAIASATVTPASSGAFTASLPVMAAPLGSYEVQAVVDGRVVVSRWLEVAVIRKPAYQLGLSTDRQAVVVGTAVRWRTAATFFDGTPVPALRLRLATSDDQERELTTDDLGVASVALEAPSLHAGESWQDPDWWAPTVSPVGPETSEIGASHPILVFPSAYDLRASGVVEDGRLRVAGSLHRVDLAKVERKLAADEWDGDAAGAALAGKAIKAVVTELIPIRRRVGTDYDFIEKVARPRYEYEIQRRELRSLTVESGADGRFTLGLTVPDPTHEYEIVLAATDGAGRRQERTIQAGQPVEAWWSDAGVVFKTSDGRPAGETRYGIGERLAWSMIDDGRAFPSGGTDRYLYLVAQRGLLSATVTDSATFKRTYRADDAPGIFVVGVRFTGATYAPKAAAWADFDPTEREIKVALSAARPRYQPGDDVQLSVRTTDVDGKPVVATVLLQAVDEKLFAIGGASVPQPLDDLYLRVDSGILRLIGSHQVPTRSGPESEGGDTTGGGERSDFRDTLVFRELTTDANGEASLTVRLSDDLTSWHFTAGAVTGDLQAGVGELLVPVGLPFFVEATLADAYLASDRPVIQLRAYGDALRAGDRVEFTVRSSSLGMAPTTVSGTAFVAAGVALPALALGGHSLDVAAVVPTRLDGSGKPRSDRLVRTFQVVASRLTAGQTAYGLVRDGLPAIGSASGLATYTFSDAGRGRYLPVLLDLVEPAGARLDRLLAQSMARRLLVAEFGQEPSSLPPAAFDAGRYAVGVLEGEIPDSRVAGVALLPYGSLDPWLAARVAMLAPDDLSRSELLEALQATRDDPATRRDLGIATLSGLAGMGEPVLPDLVAARGASDLTTIERLHLALGFQAMGDDASARDIERDLLARHGERLGSWARLRLADPDETVEATALMAVLAGGLGDPVAAGLTEYVASNPGTTTTQALELAAYAARGIHRTPARVASFAYTVGGTRSVVNLQAGQAFALSLTAGQRAGFSAETLTGDVAVAVSWRSPVDPATLRPHADLTLSRATPAKIEAGRIVSVELTAKFAASAPQSGCYEVVELAPSGLAPLEFGSEEADGQSISGPSSVSGQQVRFCASNDVRSGGTARLRYHARIVNPGTFTWEPATMQLSGAPEALAVTPAGSTIIGGQ